MKKLIYIVLIFFGLAVSVGAFPMGPKTRAEHSKTDTDSFTGNLSTADTTTQKALDTIDDITLDSTDALNELFEGVTVAVITVGDTTPPVASGGLYITTGATTVEVLDFYDSGDDNDGDFSDGDFFGLIVEDADFTIDFSTGTNIKGNADTDFTGIAANPVLVIFVWRSGVWYCTNLNSGFSDPLTFAAKTIMKVTLISGNDTLEANEQYNGRVFVSAASVLNAAGVETGMEVTVVMNVTANVDFNPDNADTITLDGTALAVGDAVRLDAAGEIMVCTGTGATTWSCSSGGDGVDVN